MLAAGNLLKPSDGKPVTVPTQDMVLGSYYLTMDNDGDTGEGKVFRDENEAVMAYQEGVITLQAKIKVRRTMEIDGDRAQPIIDTTVGRIIFNQPIPQDLGYVDRTIPENRSCSRSISSSAKRNWARSSTTASRYTARPSLPRCWTMSRRRATNIPRRARSP